MVTTYRLRVVLGERGLPITRGGRVTIFSLVVVGDEDFSLRWSTRMVNNSTPGLFNDEYEQLRYLKEILSSSWAVRNMIEEWLIEIGLSPTPWGMD